MSERDAVSVAQETESQCTHEHVRQIDEHDVECLDCRVIGA